MKTIALIFARVLVAACGADVDPSEENTTFDVPRETEQAPLPGGGHPPDGLSCKATCTGGPDCPAGTVWVVGKTKNGMCCSATRCASCSSPADFSCWTAITKNPPLPPPPPSNTGG